MPEWMEEFRPFIEKTRENTAEKVMNSRPNFDTDPLVVILQVVVQSQVNLLQKLKKAGKI